VFSYNRKIFKKKRKTYLSCEQCIVKEKNSHAISNCRQSVSNMEEEEGGEREDTLFMCFVTFELVVLQYVCDLPGCLERCLSIDELQLKKSNTSEQKRVSPHSWTGCILHSWGLRKLEWEKNDSLSAIWRNDSKLCAFDKCFQRNHT